MTKKDRPSAISGPKPIGAGSQKRVDSVREVVNVKGVDAVESVKGVGGVTGAKGVTAVGFEPRRITSQNRDHILQVMKEESEKFFQKQIINSNQKRVVDRALEMVIQAGVVDEDDKDKIG